MGLLLLFLGTAGAAQAQAVCNWESIEPIPGRTATVESADLRRDYMGLRLGQGSLYGLQACGRTVGLVFLGTGEADVRSPGPQRTPQLHGRFPDLPGTVVIDGALLVGSDGAIEDLLEQVGGLQEGPVPPKVWALVQTRINGFLFQNPDGWRPPGEVLAAPEGASGGLLVELRTQGLRTANLERSVEVLSPWLSWLWAPSGAFGDAFDPGTWFRRATGSTRHLGYGTFPSEEAVGEQNTPFALQETPAPLDLESVVLGLAASGPIGPDRMLETLEGSATLRFVARTDASPHLLLRLAEGRLRVYGDQFAPLEVKGVALLGADDTPTEVPWLRTGSRLWVTLPVAPVAGDELRLLVRYEGDVLEPEGSTAIRSLGNWSWYPRPVGVDPHKFTTTVAVPPFWDVIATGHRIGEEVSGRVKIVTSRTREPVRSGAVLIGDVRTEVLKMGEGLPLVRVHRSPEQPIPNARIGAELKEHLTVLTDILGPYPWSELEIVERGLGASGEQGLAGVIGLRRFDSPPDQIVTTRVSGDTLLGALVRQWLSVDRGWRSWHDSWLVEGLVTWARCLALEPAGYGGRCYGTLASFRQAYMDTMTSGRIANDPLAQALQSEAVWLEGGLRGPLVLHSLRLLIGDDVVRGTLKQVAQSETPVSLTSFLVAAQGLAGIDLRAFVYGWVLNTPPLPTAQVRYQLVQVGETWTLSGLGVMLSGVETDPVLPLPTPLLLSYDIGKESRVVRIVLSEVEAALRIDGLPEKPRNIQLDPAKVFPGRIKLERMD
ncbi:MAG: hypothetical protein KDA24_10390 [Deltaproteobacteria bacterium]|nr:hypothetical protein [Deltaproteobacteria bacterium]